MIVKYVKSVYYIYPEDSNKTELILFYIASTSHVYIGHLSESMSVNFWLPQLLGTVSLK